MPVKPAHSRSASSTLQAVRKSAHNPIPKGGGRLPSASAKQGRANSHQRNTSGTRSSRVAHQIQFTGYQLDACDLICNRVNKKIREYFGAIRAFVDMQEVSATSP